MRVLKLAVAMVAISLSVSIATTHYFKRQAVAASDVIKQAVELPTEGHCKLAEYMLNNSRYYTASNLRKADEINKQCLALDDKKPQ